MIVKMIRVDIDELLKLDQVGFADLIQERAGVGAITNLNFEIFGHENKTIVLKVTGDAVNA